MLNNRARSHPNPQVVLAQIEQDFLGTPLECIGNILAESLRFFESLPSAEQDRDFLLGIVKCLEALPSGRETGKRFLFDAALIQSIRGEWPDIHLSSMLVPKYGNEWAHYPVHLPSSDRTHIPRVDVVRFPQQDSLDHIALLDYPWLLHEMAHILLMGLQHRTGSDFESVLRGHSNSAKTRSLAATPEVRQRREVLLRKISEGWIGDGNGGSWYNEIAADVVALWTGGQAFLACIADTTSDGIDPYLLSDGHPSYDMRVSAAVRVATQLGLPEDANELRNRQRHWESQYAERRTSDYLTCSDPEILYAAIEETLRVCSETNLPKFDTLFSLSGCVNSKRDMDFGTGLLLNARRRYSELGDGEYEKWERNVVEELSGRVTL